MRLVTATILAGLAAPPADAADMPRPLLPAEPAPPVVVHPPDICLTGRPVEIFIEPEGRSSGILPAGMEVRIVDWPWAPSRDLWVRIKPPREALYYGWVSTRDLTCL